MDPEKEYYKDMHKAVDQIFSMSKDMSLCEFARRAGLSSTTIYNLDSYKTKYPRYQTIMKMAKAVGLSVTLQMKKGK